MDKESKWLALWNELADEADAPDPEYIVVEFARRVEAETRAKPRHCIFCGATMVEKVGGSTVTQNIVNS
jgi:hypothetical protein